MPRNWYATAVPLALLGVAMAGSPDADRARRKMDRLAKGMPKGSSVTLTAMELNAMAREDVQAAVGDGIRDAKLVFGTNRVTGSGTVNFTKLQTAKGKPPGLMTAILLRGDHDLKVGVRVTTGKGSGQVDVQSVELDGIDISGKLLDLLIDYYLKPRYPEVKIGKPFDLKYNVERLDITPAGITARVGG